MPSDAPSAARACTSPRPGSAAGDEPAYGTFEDAESIATLHRAIADRKGVKPGQVAVVSQFEKIGG